MGAQEGAGARRRGATGAEAGISTSGASSRTGCGQTAVTRNRLTRRSEAISGKCGVVHRFRWRGRGGVGGAGGWYWGRPPGGRGLSTQPWGGNSRPGAYEPGRRGRPSTPGRGAVHASPGGRVRPLTPGRGSVHASPGGRGRHPASALRPRTRRRRPHRTTTKPPPRGQPCPFSPAAPPTAAGTRTPGQEPGRGPARGSVPPPGPARGPPACRTGGSVRGATGRAGRAGP